MFSEEFAIKLLILVKYLKFIMIQMMFGKNYFLLARKNIIKNFMHCQIFA